MEFTRTTRGKEKNLNDGNEYSFHKDLQTGVRYRCVNRTQFWNYRGFLVLDLSKKNILDQWEHTHPPNPAIVSITKTRVEMKRRAVETFDQPSKKKVSWLKKIL